MIKFLESGVEEVYLNFLRRKNSSEQKCVRLWWFL